ncbi:signal peptidase II [Pelobacter propionicus]|uniref:Lipoprotein signal peptidase n=1 Tax=Pelobacter propionicus (strain DSM 2379 / NBRC 103807 / OttBd1) TaxID=338966 RepID=A1AV18_PELPD|nr:signal peptidase II [Pelobacter propionicus]ABL01189.1 signal peptidase II, Aspartic peptidase, MEROPS family A08 [Pelobacter propionicus DSM 2379]
MGRWALFSAISVVGLLLDQASKLYIHRSMELFQSIPVIDGFFNIFYIRNRGAAFSFLSQASWRLPFFIAVSLIASAVILVAFGRLRNDQKLAQASLAMIFSGAVGNLIDRVRMGEVIDFLDVYWGNHHWPAFNVADSFICVGVALLALDMLREERRAKRAV